MRLSYADSFARLQRMGLLKPGPLPAAAGVRLERTTLTGDFAGLTLPRTRLGRMLVKGATFRETDLSESTLCWCDFVSVDFTDACLRRSDLRASAYRQVNFARCDLRGADLRHSDFEACDFTDARMEGAMLAHLAGRHLPLSQRQRAGVFWLADDGDEPSGG
jgi:uncharacterized protein YjbI with pentapeptide repeats